MSGVCVCNSQKQSPRPVPILPDGRGPDLHQSVQPSAPVAASEGDDDGTLRVAEARPMRVVSALELCTLYCTFNL